MLSDVTRSPRAARFAHALMLAVLAVALVAPACALAMPDAAWADDAAIARKGDEGKPKPSELWDKGEEVGEISDGDRFSEKIPILDLTHLGNIMPTVTRALYIGVGSLVMGMCDLIEEFMGLFKLNDLFSVDLQDASLSGMYGIVSRISAKVVQPIAGGFLGIALCMSLMSFSKDAVRQGRDGTELMADMLWITVKFMFIQMLISNSMLLMHGIYDLFNFLGKVMTSAQYGGLTPSSIADQAAQFREAYAGALMQITYGGWGMSFLVALFAAVALVVVVATVLYVQFIALFRIAEIFIRSAFVGIPLVMLTHRETRGDGVRYLKKYAGACAWSLIVMVVVAIGGALMVLSGSLIKVEGASLAAVLVNTMPPLAACLVMFFLLKQAREFANDLLGSVI